MSTTLYSGSNAGVPVASPAGRVLGATVSVVPDRAMKPRWICSADHAVPARRVGSRTMPSRPARRVPMNARDERAAEGRIRVRVDSWNVNSIRARQDRVLAWLTQHGPDVLCMQETKVPDDVFPVDAFRATGYEVALYGQKGYNGVAIASRLGIEDLRRGFEDGGDE